MTQKLKFDQNFYLKYFFLLLCFEINKLILNSVAQIHKGSSNCKGEDSLSNCPRFLILSNASSKVKVLPKFMICYNFFHFGHFANPCKKQGCKIFKRRSTLLSKTINTHSTTWHLPENPSSATTPQPNTPSSINQSALSANATSSNDTNTAWCFIVHRVHKTLRY